MSQSQFYYHSEEIVNENGKIRQNKKTYTFDNGKHQFNYVMSKDKHHIEVHGQSDPKSPNNLISNIKLQGHENIKQIVPFNEVEDLFNRNEQSKIFKSINKLIMPTKNKNKIKLVNTSPIKKYSTRK